MERVRILVLGRCSSVRVAVVILGIVDGTGRTVREDSLGLTDFTGKGESGET